ncbi:MAG: uncharacterized protein QOC71_1593, partial [Thermoplasmata archaeon]|nr:uncharacterized protein [Thermoplasmata archaeon]
NRFRDSQGIPRSPAFGPARSGPRRGSGAATQADLPGNRLRTRQPWAVAKSLEPPERYKRVASNRIPLALLDEKFAVCRMDPKERTPAWVMDMPAQLVALIRTPNELCILCDEADVPRSATAVERGFRAFVLDGTIPHAVSGLLNSLTRPLAEAGISVFSLFTYDTNYLLVKDADVAKASKALEKAGFPVTEKEARAT